MHVRACWVRCARSRPRPRPLDAIERHEARPRECNSSHLPSPSWGRDQAKLERGAKRAPLNQGSGTVMRRSEEHTSELQSLMRISYDVFCLKKKNTKKLTRR